MLVAFRQRPTGLLRHPSRRIPISSRAAMDLEVIPVLVSQERDSLCTQGTGFLAIASELIVTCSVYKTLIVNILQQNRFNDKTIMLKKSLKQGVIVYSFYFIHF